MSAEWPATTFNRLKQLRHRASILYNRTYCYTELAVSSPSGSRGHRQYSLRLPRKDDQAECAWVDIRVVYTIAEGQQFRY